VLQIYPGIWRCRHLYQAHAEILSQISSSRVISITTADSGCH
jgi:hypothetical protein